MRRTILGFVLALTLLRILILSRTYFGLALLWNGILLRNLRPRYANAPEQIGAGLVVFAFFGLMSSLLPWYFKWIPWMSFVMVLSHFYLELANLGEMGRTIFGLVLPLTGAFLTPLAPTDTVLRIMILSCTCFGLAGLWNGILPRNLRPRYANALEQIGAGFVVFAFFGWMSSLLPWYFKWVPWMSFVMVVSPFYGELANLVSVSVVTLVQERISYVY